MSQLALFAISIDDVRDVFGADERLAERLRAIAAARFAPRKPRRPGFFRPLLTRDPAFGVDPTLPSRADVDALLAGGFVAPERLVQAWAIFDAWLAELAAATARLDWDPAAFERIEWNLATAGLNSDYALRRLAERPLGVPLHPLAGQVVGYAKHVHVVEATAALATALPEASEETQTWCAPLVGLLEIAAPDCLDVVALAG